MSADAPGNAPKSLLVVRLGAMGDVVHTLYGVNELRRALPETQIGWVIEERWSELLCARGTPYSGPRSPSRPLVDFVHTVNTKPWRRSPLSPETRHQFFAALKEIREQKYEAAVDFQGAIKSALLARLSGARVVFGMNQPRESPARMFYSRRLPTAGVHVVDQYKSLAETVVRELAPASSTSPHMEIAALPEFPCDRTAEAVISANSQHKTGSLVVINPGAGWGAKQWATERYGEVACAIAQEGRSVLVNYGPGEESLAEIVCDVSGGAAQPITCSIAELIALTRRASLFIGGDTGPLHLAAALGVPVVAIFGPTDPARNGPYGDQSIVIRNASSRTSLSHTSEPDPGLLHITPEEVLAAARELLERSHD